MGTSIFIPGTADFDGALYNPPRKSGLLGFYVFGSLNSLIAPSLLNHVNGRHDLTQIGFTSSAIFNKFIRPKGGSRMLRTNAPQSSTLLLVTRTTDSLADTANRPAIASTTLVETTSAGPAAGGVTVFTHSISNRLTAEISINTDGTRTDPFITVPAPVVPYDWTLWALNEIKATPTELILTDHTREVSVTTGPLTGVVEPPRTWMLGSSYAADFRQGQCDFAVAAILSNSISDADKAEVIAFIRAVVGDRLGVIV
jgi:hypothetical protein